MITPAKLATESLPFLNVFSPEYTKDPSRRLLRLETANRWRAARADWNA
jgi:hypothetical protein